MGYRDYFRVDDLCTEFFHLLKLIVKKENTVKPQLLISNNNNNGETANK